MTMSEMSPLNAVMKRAISYVTATDRNDLLMHKHSHRVSFAIGQLLRLLNSGPRSHQLVPQL